MAVEVKMDNGKWEAFSAERLPINIDNAIEGCHCKFFAAIKHLEPHELFELIPISFPMTHNIAGCELISKCIVDKWEAECAKFFSARSWRQLAMKIANDDLGNLGSVMEAARQDMKTLENTEANEARKEHALEALRSGAWSRQDDGAEIFQHFIAAEGGASAGGGQ